MSHLSTHGFFSSVGHTAALNDRNFDSNNRSAVNRCRRWHTNEVAVHVCIGEKTHSTIPIQPMSPTRPDISSWPHEPPAGGHIRHVSRLSQPPRPSGVLTGPAQPSVRPAHRSITPADAASPPGVRQNGAAQSAGGKRTLRYKTCRGGDCRSVANVWQRRSKIHPIARIRRITKTTRRNYSARRHQS